MSQLQILEKDVEIPASFFGEVDAQVRTAKAYPRDIRKSLEEAEFMATINEDVAASCFYALPPRETKDKSGKTYITRGVKDCGDRVVKDSGF